MKENFKKTINILMIFAILFLVEGAVSASENVTDDDICASSSDAEIISARYRQLYRIAEYHQQC
ncbi:hypothetical protein [Methanobrevibacter sp.]|uniref:hypothetical protein n=1 Tax=Methanobrevibacter sp. TaxID=66852 RepID=UPI0038668429